MKLVVYTLLCLCAASALADDLRLSWDGTAYAYQGLTRPRSDSVLNPANRIARLTPHSSSIEARFNFKAESDTLRGSLRPVVLADTTGRQAYLSQWQMRWRATEALSVSAGREVLNWGAAQFRSPSSPFYFANGRVNPMREVFGVDALKVSWTPEVGHTFSLARVTGAGHEAGSAMRWQDSWLAYADLRNEEWAGGLVLAKKSAQATFLGAHGQYNANDAWLIYAEACFATTIDALQSSAEAVLPFAIDTQSPRRAVMLLGTSHTFLNGQSFNLELLHDQRGYSAAQGRAYFSRAASSPALAGLALSHAPQLLGRDYLHLAWQSNLMDGGGFWRMMATHNLTDKGYELSGYGETALSGHLQIFALAALPVGTARQELSSLIGLNLVAGVKLALP